MVYFLRENNVNLFEVEIYKEYSTRKNSEVVMLKKHICQYSP